MSHASRFSATVRFEFGVVVGQRSNRLSSAAGDRRRPAPVGWSEGLASPPCSPPPSLLALVVNRLTERDFRVLTA